MDSVQGLRWIPHVGKGYAYGGTKIAVGVSSWLVDGEYGMLMDIVEILKKYLSAKKYQ
jgi:hypothetical protein